MRHEGEAGQNAGTGARLAWDKYGGKNRRHKKTLQAILSFPGSGTIAWADIEALLLAVGAEAREGRGSRVRFTYAGKVATFHRPHPEREAKPYQVRDALNFLRQAGVVNESNAI